MRSYGPRYQNQPVDLAEEFAETGNTHFLAGRVTAFEAATGEGRLEWIRHTRQLRLNFNRMALSLVREEKPALFPPGEPVHPQFPFRLTFPSPRCVRLRLAGSAHAAWPAPHPILVKDPDAEPASAWTSSRTENEAVFRSEAGEFRLSLDRFGFELRDAQGSLLTRAFNTLKGLHNAATLPFALARFPADGAGRFCASLALAPDEKIFGGGESFTRLDKRGQKLNLFTCDAFGVQTGEMYKPVPFFMSSRGFGIFLHTSAPVTADIGREYDETALFHLGEDRADLFLFLGTPAEILTEYTALTGRAPVPPLWSFGLWMSRISYKSRAEAEEVGARLRAERIPADVIHLDTNWFEKDWRCDYRFDAERFPDAAGMLRELKSRGFRVSLWQLPYFTPENPLYPEILREGYAVRDAEGRPFPGDAVIDFTNPRARAWYQGLLKNLLALGAAAIKVDFGEAAPLEGRYASGRSGWFEHNLYPLHYSEAAAEATREATAADGGQPGGYGMGWVRAAWAGSQRNPVHWGGDAEGTDSAMASSLRGALSLGLCGFTYWSCDIGGFIPTPSVEIYRRWLPFGLLLSHSRCHGLPPREPWEFGETFTAEFRTAVEMRYRLLPYLYAQSVEASRLGHPLVRPLFFGFPQDRGSWEAEDLYLLGEDLLVAPLFEEAESRPVYLPPGEWVDYQTEERMEGPGWRRMRAGEVPVILLVRAGAAIPHAPLVQHTGLLDWEKIEWRTYPGRKGSAEEAGRRACSGLFAKPGDREAVRIEVKMPG